MKQLFIEYLRSLKCLRYKQIPFIRKFRQRQLMQIQINLVLSLILANVGFIILSYTASVTVNEMGVSYRMWPDWQF